MIPPSVPKSRSAPVWMMITMLAAMQRSPVMKSVSP